MNEKSAPSPQYEEELRRVLCAGDPIALREFTHLHNEIPQDVYEKDQHFWEVLMHKLICNRLDTLALHGDSSAWLHKHGYSTDLGGY